MKRADQEGSSYITSIDVNNKITLLETSIDEHDLYSDVIPEIIQTLFFIEK